jgi:hypothetical protein
VDARIVEYLRCCTIAFVAVPSLICAWAPRANAIAPIRFQDPFEHAIGVSGAFVAFDVEPAAPPSVIVDAGERYLYDVPELKTTEARVGFRRGAVGGLVSGVFLQSPVGREATVAVEPFVQRGAAGIGIELGVHSLALDGIEAASAVTVGARARMRLAPSLHLGYAIENVRVLGDELPGADSSLHLFILRTVSGVAQVRFSRSGEAAVSVASWVRLGRSLAIAAGYDDGTGMLKGAATVGVGTFTLGVGASLHTFLGLSESVFLAWRR